MLFKLLLLFYSGCSFPSNSMLPGNATFLPNQNSFTGLFPDKAPLDVICVQGFTRFGPLSHLCQPFSTPQFPTLNKTTCRPGKHFTQFLFVGLAYSGRITNIFKI